MVGDKIREKIEACRPFKDSEQDGKISHIWTGWSLMEKWIFAHFLKRHRRGCEAHTGGFVDLGEGRSMISLSKYLFSTCYDRHNSKCCET